MQGDDVVLYLDVVLVTKHLLLIIDNRLFLEGHHCNYLNPHWNNKTSYCISPQCTSRSVNLSRDIQIEMICVKHKKKEGINILVSYSSLFIFFRTKLIWMCEKQIKHSALNNYENISLTAKVSIPTKVMVEKWFDKQLKMIWFT
jgi:hypothetical protein